MKVSYQEQVRCVERELTLRRRNYPRWVAGAVITQAQADREIRAMQAVLETVRDAAKKEQLPLDPV